MGTLNFTQQQIVSQGTYDSGSATYNVSTTIIDNATQKNKLQVLNVQVQEKSNYVGDIRLENGRRIANLVEGSNIIEHLTAFQFILDSILGRDEEEAEAAEMEVE